MEEDYKKHYKKLYEDALETAKAYYKQNKGVVDGVECLSIIFPELKESEDEGIREELLSLFKDGRDGRSHRYTGSDCERYIAWLEKQGEQETDKIIERARTEKQRVLLTETNGDAHVDWDCRSLRDVKLLLKYGLEYISCEGFKKGANWQKEQEMLDRLKSDNTVFQKFYEKGKAEMKEQMMKDAIPARVSFGQVVLQERPISTSVAKDGDKVKIIIVKEEEK